MSDYENLLDNVYTNLPDKIKSEERFETPKFDSFIEGNKTIIKNFEAVVSTLRREKDFLMKFLTKELAVPISIAGERLILQRKVQPTLLNKKLEEFVKEYVVCKICGKPDTNIQTSKGMKELVCEACGGRHSIK